MADNNSVGTPFQEILKGVPVLTSAFSTIFGDITGTNQTTPKTQGGGAGSATGGTTAKKGLSSLTPILLIGGVGLVLGVILLSGRKRK